MNQADLVAAALVGLGGAVGSVLRWSLAEAGARLGAAAAWPTLAANLTGCLLIGLVVGLAPRASTRLLVVTGLCGGYTTFSAFSLQTVELLQRGALLGALLNVTGSILGCLAATASGLLLASALARGG